MNINANDVINELGNDISNYAKDNAILRLKIKKLEAEIEVMKLNQTCCECEDCKEKNNEDK